MKKKAWIIPGIFILAVIVSVIILNNSKEEITSFEECVAAGYPVMESYPRQCSVPGGKTFTEDISVGGERDEYGCLIAAGYSRSEPLDACVREWEISERTYMNENSEFCKAIEFYCEEGFVPFYDDTGCGCEPEFARQHDVCTKESRKAEACITIYDPVCGMPIKETFGNSCVACQDEKVIYYIEGEC